MHDIKNVVAKWISKEEFPKNCLGELSNSSSRRKTHDCFEELPSNFTSEGCPIDFIGNRYYVFKNKKPFVLKIVFSHTWLRHA